ncbi:MAG: S8 family serine peptidase [bacterium]|nr:S8 family serine peptidase [bacterium]
MKKIIHIIIFLSAITLINETQASSQYPADSLLKQKNSSNSAVYYIANDGKKYIFPDLKTYHTWYDDFSKIIEVSVEVLDSFPNGGAMPYHQASKLITTQNTNKIYAVEPNGVLKYIPSEDMAKKLYGNNWYRLVQDVLPGFFASSYKIDGELDGKYPTGTLVKDMQTIKYYYIENGLKRPFESDHNLEYGELGFEKSDAIASDELSDYDTGKKIDYITRDINGFDPASQMYFKKNSKQCIPPDELSTKQTIPNDPYFNKQVGFNNLGSSQGLAGAVLDADIDAPEAWSVETGKGKIIAFIDTGLNVNHEDIKDNLWININELPNNGVDDDKNGYIDDVHGWNFENNNSYLGDIGMTSDHPEGHGQLVAGIAAATGNNNKGITGLCWNCSIMPLKGLGYSIKSIPYAVDNGANVINMSFLSAGVQAIKDALDYAYSHGVILVGGAGNDSKNQPNAPADFDNVLAVSGTAAYNKISWWSNYGSWIDVSAPGDAYTTAHNNESYIEETGTSLSASYVSGLAALILSKNPAFNPEEVYSIIRSSVDEPADSDKYFGIGRINAAKSLQYNSIPIAKFSSTLDDATITKPFNIVGTAISASFNNYKVEYGSGNYPKEWQLVKESGSEKINSTLVSFDPTKLNPGVYTFKLTVADDCGNTALDKFNVNITK